MGDENENIGCVPENADNGCWDYTSLIRHIIYELKELNAKIKIIVRMIKDNPTCISPELKKLWLKEYDAMMAHRKILNLQLKVLVKETTNTDEDLYIEKVPKNI